MIAKKSHCAWALMTCGVICMYATATSKAKINYPDVQCKRMNVILFLEKMIPPSTYSHFATSRPNHQTTPPNNTAADSNTASTEDEVVMPPLTF
jgi:hypothetical protein